MKQPLISLIALTSLLLGVFPVIAQSSDPITQHDRDNYFVLKTDLTRAYNFNLLWDVRSAKQFAFAACRNIQNYGIAKTINSGAQHYQYSTKVMTRMVGYAVYGYCENYIQAYANFRMRTGVPQQNPFTPILPP